MTTHEALAAALAVGSAPVVMAPTQRALDVFTEALEQAAKSGETFPPLRLVVNRRLPPDIMVVVNRPLVLADWWPLVALPSWDPSWDG